MLNFNSLFMFTDSKSVVQCGVNEAPNERNILACDQWYPDVTAFFKKAKASGLPYFEWNGRVYLVDGDEFHYIGEFSMMVA